IACRTGEACGFTDTRSSALSSENQSAVIRLTIEALDAWCPPTLTPERFSRTRLAWWTMAVASQSTRRCTASSSSRSASARGRDGALVIGIPLKTSDSPIPHGEHDVDRQRALDPTQPACGLPGAARRDPIAVRLDVVRLDRNRLPDAQPLVDAFAESSLSLHRGLLGPVLAGLHDDVVPVQLQQSSMSPAFQRSPTCRTLSRLSIGLKKRTVHPFP